MNDILLVLCGGVIGGIVAYGFWMKEKRKLKKHYEQNLLAVEIAMRENLNQVMDMFQDSQFDEGNRVRRKRGSIIVIDCEAKE